MDHSARLSIKEFANFTGLPESTLRYYDTIGLLSPEIRGENRYRYYSPLQTITVEFIKVLTRVGVPLSAIKELHEKRTPPSVLDLLTQQENKLDRQLRELQAAYSIIHTYRNNIQAGLSVPEHDEIQVRELDEAYINLGPAADFSNTDTFYDPFMEFCNTALENKIDLHYPIGGYYENIDVFVRTPSQPTRFFSLDPHGNCKRSAGPYLVAHNKGYYGEFGGLPLKLLAYSEAQGLALVGPLYITYLLDEISLADHHQYLSQIAVGVSKKR
jgi:DNA-binding transcriptional MerR regulator